MLGQCLTRSVFNKSEFSLTAQTFMKDQVVPHPVVAGREGEVTEPLWKEVLTVGNRFPRLWPLTSFLPWEKPLTAVGLLLSGLWVGLEGLSLWMLSLTGDENPAAIDSWCAGMPFPGQKRIPNHC